MPVSTECGAALLSFRYPSNINNHDNYVGDNNDGDNDDDDGDDNNNDNKTTVTIRIRMITRFLGHYFY